MLGDFLGLVLRIGHCDWDIVICPSPGFPSQWAFYGTDPLLSENLCIEPGLQGCLNQSKWEVRFRQAVAMGLPRSFENSCLSPSEQNNFGDECHVHSFKSSHQTRTHSLTPDLFRPLLPSSVSPIHPALNRLAGKVIACNRHVIALAGCIKRREYQSDPYLACERDEQEQSSYWLGRIRLELISRLRSI